MNNYSQSHDLSETTVNLIYFFNFVPLEQRVDPLDVVNLFLFKKKVVIPTSTVYKENKIIIAKPYRGRHKILIKMH